MSVLTVAVVVALLCGDSASAATDLIHHEVLDENGDFLLFWTYDGAQIELEARVRTRGWVGLGLSPNGGMPGSDIVIGWVKDGQAYLTDRYADEKALPPEDESQDWELLSGYENDTHTVLRFKRKLQTCDVRDRVINKDTQRVLWAWNDRDPDDVTGPAYHTHRGVRSSILLRNDIEAESLPNVIRSHDVVMTNTAIPSKQTTYWCKLVEMPPLQTKHHIFKVQPVITPGNEGVVHHILVYKCHINPNRTAAPQEHPGHECFTPNMPLDWKECYQGNLIAVWGIGTGDLSFPSHVGYPIGDEDDGGQVLMEVHYDNPEQKEGMTDNSGLRLLYTPELRQHDVGVLLVSQSVDHALVIPPRAVEYNVDNFCHQECLDTFLDEAGEPVQVFGVMPHAHLLAKKMRTTLIRDGVETVLSSDDNYDFNLQYIRMLEEEVTIKKGDTIMTRCTYNSEHKTEPVYGGLSTENEMCDSFLFYYPRMSLRWCESHAHPLNILGFAGVQEIGSEAPVFIDSIPIVKPANMSNMTYLDVVESIVWGQDKAQQYSQHLRSGNFVSRCGGKMQTDGDTILYTKESLLPHPTVPAAAPVFTCSTSSGTVGPQLSAPLPFMAVMTSLTILFTL
ncbi:DBH-like monooxygenase protein 1 homolog isoform X2 [Branchiostoma floridae]|uniref:DBH-like monooxygenase protein 1 homolog isoform X2 n=1 Tax=Branchiostoma floridae TaxID=7739 RepID=A0A9J7M0Y7_BRAFL|nr:DBH-like monooxygenase protein 1 homolog isoform X2 [Branchiostoma floridae]